MKIKTYITAASMLTMSFAGGYSQSAFTAPLDIDSNFGDNGTAINNLIADQDGDVYHISTGVATNNKVVTLTGIDLFNTNQKVYALAGFDNQGNPDPGFGNGGKAFLWHLVHHEAHEMAVQTDGKIIVVGRANTHVSGSKDMFAARYLANGTLDISFGHNGIATRANLPYLVSGFGIHVATQSNGGIILAGGTDDISLIRLNSNGTVDNTFGSHFILPVTISDLGGDEMVMDMEVDDQDRIVVVGSYSPTSSEREIFVARFTAKGLLDKNDFIPTGCAPSCGYTTLNVYDTHPDIPADSGWFTGWHFQMDVALKKPHNSGIYNKIVVSGSFGIARLNEDGNEDTSFGVNGRVQNNLQFVDSYIPGYNYVEIRSDGLIANLNNYSSTLALYDSHGQLALECTSGISFVDIPHNQTITPIIESDLRNYGMKIDANNQIVYAGTSIVPDDFNMEHEAAFAERYQRYCDYFVEEDDGPDWGIDIYKKADPTTKMTIRDVHPFVHPQDIVGPEWKIRF